LLLLGLAVLAGMLIFQRTQKVEEEKRYQEALAELRQHNYVDATHVLRELEREFADSPNLAAYRFLAELCETIGPAYQTHTDAVESRRHLDDLRQFSAAHQGESLLDEHQEHCWQAVLRLADQAAALAEQQVDAAFLETGRLALDEAGKLRPPSGGDADGQVAAIRKTLERASRAVTRRQEREGLLDALARISRPGEVNSYPRALELIEKHAGLKNDLEVQTLLNKIPEIQRERVKYTTVASFPAPPPDDEEETSLLVVRRVGAAPEDVRPGGRVVVALARGVLYGLEPADGRLRWARRVGADAAELPVRVPETPVAPERLLVLAADGRALTAVEAASGRLLWRHPLVGASTGRAILVGDRAFLPMTTGRVDEVETTAGRLVGYYDLGEPLQGEGAHQAETSLLFVPAQGYSVYVLDVNQRKCVAILYSGHPSGSLRGAPVAISEANPVVADKAAKAVPGYLMLTQAETLETTRLRVFALPVAAPDQKAFSPEPPLPGWVWFPPVYDPEKLALVTDAGKLTLFGVKQPGSRDSVLFPITSQAISHTSGQAAGGPGLIVHRKGRHYWVLSQGQLQKWQAGFFRDKGPRLIPRWTDALSLGLPLHGPQIQVGQDAMPVLFLTTQGSDHACLASAVEGRTGTLRWQESLGLVAERPPLAVGKRLLVLDQAGGLVLFNLGARKDLSPGFALGGTPLSGSGGPPVLLLFKGVGNSAHVLEGSNKGEPATYTLRRLDLDGKAAPEVREFSLQRAFLGTPAVGPGCLVFPLANGLLVRQPLAGGPAVAGLQWRARHADDDAPGHVVWAGGSDYLITDGSSELRRLTWPEGTTGEQKAAVSLPQRIVAPPAVLVPVGKDGDLRIVIADAGGTISLVEGEDLKVARQWTLPGTITAGPFARGGKVGCILDRRRLVWLEPVSKEPAWEYIASADIVGEPQLVGDLLVVASLDGHFVGVDPETGDAQGPGYTLRANVAPSAAPVSWEEGLLFAPLTDGTVLLLPQSRLQRAKTR
jgi:outer membrane protein assembly factor BamB